MRDAIEAYRMAKGCQAERLQAADRERLARGARNDVRRAAALKRRLGTWLIALGRRWAGPPERHWTGCPPGRGNEV